LKLRCVVDGHFSRYNLSKWWTLNLDEFPRLCYTIGTSTEPVIYGMGTETKFMDNLSVSLFIEDPCLIFILFTVPRGCVPRELLTQTTLLQ
jgi:hypothetical protein